MGLFSGIAGSLGFDVGGFASAYMSNRAAKQQQQRQLDWEKERAQNAHQWEVEDLKKAGLNPILSAGGQGAITGSIGAPMPDYSGLAGISASAAARKQAKIAEKAQEKQSELQDAQIQATNEQARLTMNEATNSALQGKLIKEELEAKKPQLQNQASFYGSKVGRGLQYAGMTGQQIMPWLNLTGGMIGGAIIGGAARKATSALKAKSQTNVPIGQGINRLYNRSDKMSYWETPAYWRRTPKVQ